MSQVTTINIEDVQPHPDNPRLHDLDAIAASLERFGQTKPIIVQKSTGYVVAGNGTRQAALQLGWTDIDALVVDFDDDKAKAYLAADNRTSDRAKYDTEQLLDLLDGLEDLDGTGFDMDDVDDMRAPAEVNDETGEVVKTVPPPRGADKAPKAKAEKAEPVRDIVMLMTVSRAAAFGENVRRLQKHYGTSSVVDTVERAVNEACAGL